MSAGPSIEEVNGKNSGTSSIEDIHKREAKPHTLDATTQPEERGEPAGQSDSAIRSPSPVTHTSAVTIAEKPILSPVYEPPHFASRHPRHQELTAYVNALLKHNPQPPLLSSANSRRRTTSLRLPSGVMSVWTVDLSVCLSVCLFVHVSVYVRTCACVCACVSTCLSIFMSVSLSFCVCESE